jgi:hypothetical protein
MSNDFWAVSGTLGWLVAIVVVVLGYHLLQIDAVREILGGALVGLAGALAVGALSADTFLLRLSSVAVALSSRRDIPLR